MSRGTGQSHAFVFISYSQDDAEFAAGFARRLKKAGIDHFLDLHAIAWGEAIPESIRNALHRATHLVVLISPGSERSQWVAYETGFASAQDLILVPYLLHPRMNVPGYLAERRHIRTLVEEAQFLRGLRRFRVKPLDEDEERDDESRRKVRPVLTHRDVAGLDVACGSDYSGVEVEFRRFKKHETVVASDLERVAAPFFPLGFELLALFSGVPASSIVIGRSKTNTRRDFAQVDRRAAGFRPRYREYGMFSLEVSCRHNILQQIDDGFIQAFFMPYRNDDGVNYQHVLRSAAATKRVGLVMKRVEPVLLKVAEASLGETVPRILWQPPRWRKDCGSSGADAYAISGMVL